LMHSIIVLAVVACVIAVPGIAAALAAFLPGEVAIVTRTAAAFGLGYAAAGGCAFLLAAAPAFPVSFFFPLWLGGSAALWGGGLPPRTYPRSDHGTNCGR